MIPVSAIADDKVLDVKADDGQVHTEEHGGENYDRVNVKASNNSTANVNVGEVSNAGSDDPAVAVKTASATSNVQTGDIVSGDVGVNAKTNGENSTTTILTGNIDSGNWGVRALTGGENTITTKLLGSLEFTGFKASSFLKFIKFW